MELQKNTLYIISVVAIVAIVGVVALFLSKSGSLGSDDLAGQAVNRRGVPSSLQSGVWANVVSNWNRCDVVTGGANGRKMSGGRNTWLQYRNGCEGSDYYDFKCTGSNVQVRKTTCANGCGVSGCNSAPLQVVSLCAGVSCPARCSGNDRQTGSCTPSTGQCAYTTAETCANGCSGGGCNAAAQIADCAIGSNNWCTQPLDAPPETYSFNGRTFTIGGFHTSRANSVTNYVLQFEGNYFQRSTSSTLLFAHSGFKIYARGEAFGYNSYRLKFQVGLTQDSDLSAQCYSIDDESRQNDPARSSSVDVYSASQGNGFIDIVSQRYDSSCSGTQLTKYICASGTPQGFTRREYTCVGRCEVVSCPHGAI